MATPRAKESSGLGKERKITAPTSISIPNTPTKRTPKSSPRGLSTDHKLPFSSSSSSSSSPNSSTTSLPTLSEKHVPNYLKSTASSRHDHTTFKPIKKSPSGPAPIPEGKSSLNRRRSFDKPPPSTPRLDKPFRSPGPRNRANTVPIRSSSFGAKPTTTFVSSSKHVERSTSKISKVGGKPQQAVHSLKSSSNVKKSFKRESSNNIAASEEMVPKPKNDVEHVHQSPSFVIGMNEEELDKIEYELDPYLPDPMPELDKQLGTDQEKKKAIFDKEEVGRKDAAETFKVVVSKDEVHITPRAADTKSSIWKEESRNRNEEEKPERIAVEKFEVVVVAAASEESTDSQNEEKETEKMKVGALEKEPEKTAVAAGKVRQGVSGRKESPAMYNHVIEETASKLLEKRKNKVRALAGAFQTVIDYESSSK